MADMKDLVFISESNRIEGINRAPTRAEINEYERFMELKEVHIDDLERFVWVNAGRQHKLRSEAGVNVRVANHIAPAGGIAIVYSLMEILNNLTEHPFIVHQLYEKLHPFTDGNGRSGRILWRWMMKQRGGNDERMAKELGFLHTWYYQSLEKWRDK